MTRSLEAGGRAPKWAPARYRIGMITPSANLVVEGITTAILADYPHVSAHFSRIGVVGAHDPDAQTYDWDMMVRAAELLAHAKPACIIWNGTMGSSFGFDVDRELCRRITVATGLPASTATLAIATTLEARNLRRIGLVTPYWPAYQAKVIATYAANGFECIAEAHAGLDDNFDYCLLPAAEIRSMLATVARKKPDVIVASCTNFPSAPQVAEAEISFGIPIVDSTSIAVAEGLHMAGVPASAAAAKWGKLFEDLARAERSANAARTW